MDKHKRLRILGDYYTILNVNNYNEVLIVYDNQKIWVNKNVEYIEKGDQIFGKDKTVVGIFYSPIVSKLYVDFYDDCIDLNSYIKSPNFKRISIINKILC